MKISTKAALITFVFGAPAFLLGRIIWPDAPDIVPPTAGQLPWFALVAFVEAAAFGLGMAFIFFAWPLVTRLPKPASKAAKWTYVSIAWLLVSWWPHDNLHRHIGMNTFKLLFIELGFHVTLIIASLVVAYCFWTLVKERAAAQK